MLLMVSELKPVLKVTLKLVL